MGSSDSKGYTGLNKIITSRLSYYDKKYSGNELILLFHELRKIDLLSKSTSIKDKMLLHNFIITALLKEQNV